MTTHADDGSRRKHRRKATGAAAAVAAMLALAVPMAIGGGDPAGGQVTTPPFELVDAGSLTLTTKLTATGNNVVRRDAADAVVSTQGITVPSSCAMSTSPTLLAITTSKAVPGLSSGTIGDRTKGSGTDCGLVESGASLTIALGSQISDLEMSSFAFDIETRKNLRLVLTASLDGATTATYELRSGTSAASGGSTTPGSSIFDCNTNASSDPNAQDRDNCRFSGTVLADKLVLLAVVGEFGLSGGAAGGTTAPSVIELTDIDGLLDCESQPNEGDFDLVEGGNGTPEVGLIRKDNLDDNEACELIPVDLNTSVEGGIPQFEFLKDLTNQESAAFTLDVTWPFEAAQNPPPPTQFEFFEAEGSFPLEWCVGTPVYEAGVFMGIDELLNDITSDDGVVPDQSDALDGKQYACYYFQDGGLVENGTVEVFQKLYVVGDFRGSR